MAAVLDFPVFVRPLFVRYKRSALAAAVALTFGALGAFAAPVFADDASPARVTPVDTSNGQIRTTVLPGSAASTGQAAVAAKAPSASGARNTVSSTPAPANTVPGQVVVGGKVPDEATHAAVLQRLRDTYGTANVVDQIEVGDVSTPPNWSENVQKLINPELKQVHKDN